MTLTRLREAPPLAWPDRSLGMRPKAGRGGWVSTTPAPLDRESQAAPVPRLCLRAFPSPRQPPPPAAFTAHPDVTALEQDGRQDGQHNGRAE